MYTLTFRSCPIVSLGTRPGIHINGRAASHSTCGKEKKNTLEPNAGNAGLHAQSIRLTHSDNVTMVWIVSLVQFALLLHNCFKIAHKSLRLRARSSMFAKSDDAGSPCAKCDDL